MNSSKRYLDFNTGSNAITQHKLKMGKLEHVILTLFLSIMLTIILIKIYTG